MLYYISSLEIVSFPACQNSKFQILYDILECSLVFNVLNKISSNFNQ